MKDNVTLSVTSLLTILFLTFHLSDEITRGMEPGRFMVIPIFVLAIWVYAALALAGCGEDFVQREFSTEARRSRRATKRSLKNAHYSRSRFLTPYC